MATPNTNKLYVSRRQAALILAGITQQELVARLVKRFGSCSTTLMSQIVLGTSRSHDKELAFAEAVGKTHSYLFAKARKRRA